MEKVNVKRFVEMLDEMEAHEAILFSINVYIGQLSLVSLPYNINDLARKFFDMVVDDIGAYGPVTNLMKLLGLRFDTLTTEGVSKLLSVGSYELVIAAIVAWAESREIVTIPEGVQKTPTP